jgi:dipeptidyl aminopeptidase/acylaminoacyl peptidase
VYLPVGFDAKMRYPAIVNYYGGTSPIDRSFGGRYPAEWWAANGYVVYVLNPTGAYGWGQAHSAVHVNDWGEVTSRQIIDATTAFLRSHAYVDPGRVGCIGASYGGFMTMKLVTETDIFAAAVAHAGISALSSYWGEGYWGYSYGAVANADSFPWNREEIFIDRSPLFHADAVNTPVLLTHGDDDPNVPPGESDQFFAALKLLGTPVEYLRVAGLGHLIMEHDKRELWSRSIVAWFDRWLKDEPEWWEALYPDDS